MIPLRRSPEPSKLSSQRAERLEDARMALASGEKIDFDGYNEPEIKKQLFEDQSYKCAFCETRQEQARYNDVEHFRPKSTYWWLAWTWENLLFSCVYCNRDHKKTLFPLRGSSQRLVAEELPPGGELPLLLDPYDASIDPHSEIEFRLGHVADRERWQPVGLTARGWASIFAFGLDRPPLLDKYADHVRDLVRPRVELFQSALENTDRATALAAWNRLCGSLFAPRQDFHALSRAAIAILLRDEIREYRLPL
jgi:hypothetical protein